MSDPDFEQAWTEAMHRRDKLNFALAALETLRDDMDLDAIVLPRFEAGKWSRETLQAMIDDMIEAIGP